MVSNVNKIHLIRIHRKMTNYLKTKDEFVNFGIYFCVIVRKCLRFHWIIFFSCTASIDQMVNKIEITEQSAGPKEKSSNDDNVAATAQPKHKKVKLETNEEMNVKSDGGSTLLPSATDSFDCSTGATKVDNLEQFPAEILEKIFMETDDVAF